MTRFLAGVVRSLAGDGAVVELDRIRHQTTPAPPVETQLDALLQEDSGKEHGAGGGAAS